MSMYYLRRLNFEHSQYWNDHEQLKQHNTSNRIPFTSALSMFFFYNNNQKREMMSQQEIV